MSLEKSVIKRQYFKDDLSLISDKHNAVYLAAIGKKEEQKKITDKKRNRSPTKTIYVQVPNDNRDDSNTSATIMEEFVFELDDEGKDYYYQFGKT